MLYSREPAFALRLQELKQVMTGSLGNAYFSREGVGEILFSICHPSI